MAKKKVTKKPAGGAAVKPKVPRRSAGAPASAIKDTVSLIKSEAREIDDDIVRSGRSRR